MLSWTFKHNFNYPLFYILKVSKNIDVILVIFKYIQLNLLIEVNCNKKKISVKHKSII